MPDLHPSPFLDVAEAAARLKLKPATLKRYRIVGNGPPYIKISARRVIYDAARLDEWARAREFASTSAYGAPLA